MKTYNEIIFLLSLFNLASCTEPSCLTALKIEKNSIKKIIIERLTKECCYRKELVLEKDELKELFNKIEFAKGKEIFIVVPKFKLNCITNSGEVFILFAGDDWLGPKVGSSTVADRFFLETPYFASLMRKEE